jgi:hypothetical protein
MADGGSRLSVGHHQPGIVGGLMSENEIMKKRSENNRSGSCGASKIIGSMKLGSIGESLKSVNRNNENNIMAKSYRKRYNGLKTAAAK